MAILIRAAYNIYLRPGPNLFQWFIVKNIMMVSCLKSVLVCLNSWNIYIGQFASCTSWFSAAANGQYQHRKWSVLSRWNMQWECGGWMVGVCMAFMKGGRVHLQSQTCK